MNALERARVEHGLTQKQAAEKVGISWRWWAEMESGRRGPGRELEKKIEHEFGVKRDEIVKEEPK